MAYSQAQNRATRKYNEKAYDRVYLLIPKGTKEHLQAHAHQFGKSLNGFINEAIDEKIERDKGGQEQCLK